MKKFISRHIVGAIFLLLVLVSVALWLISGDSIGAKETPFDYKGKTRQEMQK